LLLLSRRFVLLRRRRAILVASDHATGYGAFCSGVPDIIATDRTNGRACGGTAHTCAAACDGSSLRFGDRGWIRRVVMTLLDGPSAALRLICLLLRRRLALAWVD
jgi:hypothetical protein